MSNELEQRHANLPADFGDSLMRGIDDTRASLVTSGGLPFLRLMRNGVWVFGQTNDEVIPGSRWAVNLASLQRGWVCWGDGELLGQVMSSVQVPRPICPPPVNGYPYAEQYSMELACISGEDAGMEVLYKNNSYGFKVAFETLISAIRERYAVEKVYYWPVIELGQEHYSHKKYGIIYNPLLPIVAWADADGNIADANRGRVATRQEADTANVERDTERLMAAQPRQAAARAPAPAPEPEPAPAPRAAPRSRQRAAAPVQPEPAPAPEPEPPVVSTQRQRVGQRRRPAA